MNWELPPIVESFLVAVVIVVVIAVLGFVTWGLYTLSIYMFGVDGGQIAAVAGVAFLALWGFIWMETY